MAPCIAVFEEVKRLFDPANLLNPGKIVGGDEDLMTRNLRPVLLASETGGWGLGAGESSSSSVPVQPGTPTPSPKVAAAPDVGPNCLCRAPSLQSPAASRQSPSLSSCN